MMEGEIAPKIDNEEILEKKYKNLKYLVKDAF